MADSQHSTLFRNLCILHLQRLTLELKCPLCLNLLNKPLVFPCNHIFCDGCIVMSEESEQKCPTCELQCLDQEIRPAPYMENIVRLCQSLEETVNAKAYQPSSEDHLSKQNPSTVNTNCNSQKKHPTDIPQKRVYAIHLDGSASSIQGETESLKPKLEEGEHDSDCVIISDDEDDDIVIKEEPQSEDCKAAEHFENIMTMKEPQTEDCKAGEGNIKCPDRKSSVLRDVSDKGLVDNDLARGRNGRPNMDVVHPDTSFTWTKKRKRLNLGASQKVRESDRTSKQGVHSSDSIKELGHDVKSIKHRLVPHSSPLSKTADPTKLVCAFCHSSEQTDGTGKLLGFVDKKEIVLTSLSSFSRSKVLIGHEKCVYWSPQVFFEGEYIQNLESEVARAAKLKCCSCGKKGAGLGCYLDSCQKTYHVPCAYYNHEIRWDCENYLMLCPSHSSCKFPGEMSESETCSEKQICHSPPKISLEQSNFWAKTPGGKKELVLCGSSLSAENQTQLDNFATRCGINVSKSWNQNVTHVIVSTDAAGACTRTFEFLMAILNGKWIVKMNWLKACIKENYLLDELHYECKLDNFGSRDGPERGRLDVSGKGKKLFADLRFYFFGDFEPEELKEMLELVEAAGGIVESSRESMRASRMVSASNSCFLVYNCDPPKGNPEGDTSFLKAILKEAVDVAVDLQVGVMRHKWISDSIAEYRPIPWS